MVRIGLRKTPDCRRVHANGRHTRNDPNRRRNCALIAHLLFHRKRKFKIVRIGQSVRNDRALQRNHRLPGIERRLHFGRNRD